MEARDMLSYLIATWLPLADISGAFNKVSNELPRNCDHAGIVPALLIMRSYLSPRAFYVVLQCCFLQKHSYSQFYVSSVRARSHVMELPFRQHRRQVAHFGGD